MDEVTTEISAEATADVVETTTQVAGESAPIVESEKPAPAEQPAKKDSLATRFAVLTKREQAILARERALKAAEESGKTQSAELGSKAQLLEKIRVAAESGDAAALVDALGVKDEGKFAKLMEGLTHYTLRVKDLPPEVREMQQKLRDLQAERDAEKAAKDAADKDAADRRAEEKKNAAAKAETQFKENLAHFITQKAAEFETLDWTAKRSPSAKAHVLQRMFEECQKAWEASGGENGGNIDVDKAAQMVEDELAAAFVAEQAELLKLKKLQPKADPAPPASNRERFDVAMKQVSAPPANPRAKTITNAHQAAPNRDKGEEPTDADACFARALKIMP